MSLFRDAASMLLTTTASVALGFVGSVVTARWLSLEERGQLALALGVTTTIVMVVQLGLPAAAIFRLRRTRIDAGRVAGAALASCVLLSAVALGIGAPLRGVIAERLLADAPVVIVVLALANVPFVLVANVFSGIARGIDRFDLQNLHRFARSLLVTLATIGVLVVAGRGLRELLEAQLAVTAVLALLLVSAVARRTGVSFARATSESRELAQVGAKSWIATMAGTLHERVDVFMLALLLHDAEVVAVYAIAVSLSSLVKLAPESMAAAMFPHVAGLDEDEAGRVSAALLRHSTLWMAVTVVGAIALAPWLIPAVYGAPYVASVAVFDVLMLGVVFLTTYRLLSRYFFAIDRQGINIVLQYGAVAINLALNLVLIPRYGAMGAALSSLGSYGLQALACAVWFQRASGIGPREMLVFRVEDLDPYVRRVRARLRP